MLVVVCVLVLLEATLLVGVGIAFGAQLVRGASVPGAAVFLLVFMLGVAAVLVASTRGLWRGRRWARSPVLTWQLLLAVLAFGWLGVEATWWAGLVLAGLQEWHSHKESQPGPRARAENRARREFPLFLGLLWRKP